MRKRGLFIFFLFCGAMTVFAQNADLKYYTDYEEGLSGYACAYYVVNVHSEAPDLPLGAETIIDNVFSSFTDGSVEGLTVTDKLTRNNTWLIETALGEWDGEVGDFYFVVCADSLMAKNYVVSFSLCKGSGDFATITFLATQDGLARLAEQLDSQ